MKFFQLSALLFLLSLFVAAPQVVAQDKRPSFNLKNFLQRLDRNQNGKLEPGEIPDDRTRSLLQKSGVDVSKPVDIKSFSNKIKEQKKERRQANRTASSSRNLPGFEVDHDSERTMGFAVTDAERETTTPTGPKRYSDAAKKMTDWVLDKYDKNKNGKLEPPEVKAGRWSDPPAADSDTNKDGTLSRVELLRRYQSRDTNEDTKESNKPKSRSRKRARSLSSRSRQKRSSSSKTSTASTDPANDNIRRGYESYVKGIFKKFDANSDGSLDKDEVEEMRRKPNKGADTDKDGKISQEELLNSYLVKAGQDPTGSGSAKSTSSPSGSRASTRQSTSGARPREPLTDKDTNKDGQIDLSEYAGSMSQKKIDAFYKIDKNGDGVITRSEWEKK